MRPTIRPGAGGRCRLLPEDRAVAVRDMNSRPEELRATNAVDDALAKNVMGKYADEILALAIEHEKLTVIF